MLSEEFMGLAIGKAREGMARGRRLMGLAS
jgi:hypothetical protein